MSHQPTLHYKHYPYLNFASSENDNDKVLASSMTKSALKQQLKRKIRLLKNITEQIISRKKKLGHTGEERKDMGGCLIGWFVV